MPDNHPLYDAILNAKDEKIEPFSCPEWEPGLGGEKLFIRRISGTERGAWEESVAGRNGNTNMMDFRERFAVIVLCDKDGKRIFTDAQAASLRQKSAAVLERIRVQAWKLNGMDEEDLKDAEKNSEAAQSGASGSGSQVGGDAQ